MKKINYPLIIGTIIVIFLLLISIYPENFSQGDPYGKQFEQLSYRDGKFKGVTPPIAPCKEFPWGTDTHGRDMKSLIIYGCKSTMIMALAIALGRLCISIPISIMAAYKNRFALWLIKQFSVIFSAFPLVLVVIIAIQWDIMKSLFGNMMIPIALLLIFLGWSKLANMLTQKVGEILNEDFIEGEIAIGKSRLEIAIQNIIPHIIPTMIVLFFLEIAMVLVALAQIGILGTIVNNSFFDAEGNMNTPLEFDWPTLFIFSYYLFGSDKTWLILYPALAFGVSIMGFNLFGEGLRLEFDKKASKVISFIKSIPALLSPARYTYQIRRIGEYKMTVLKKTVTIIVVIAIIIFPRPQNAYELDAQSAFKTINTMNEIQKDSLKSGSLEKDFAKHIEGELKEYGVMPFEGKLLHEFETDKRIMKDASLTVYDGDQSMELQLERDYLVLRYALIDGIFDMEFVSCEDILNKNIDVAKLQNKVVLVDGPVDENFGKLSEMFSKVIQPKGVIYITKTKSGELGRIENVQSGYDQFPVIFMAADKSEKLLKLENTKIKLKITDCKRKITNVLGIIPGSDESLKNEYIIIGSSISNYTSNTGELHNPQIDGISMEIEIAKDIMVQGIKPKKTIIFAFWGGDQEGIRGSKYFVEKYLQNNDKKVFYIELKDLTSRQSKDILIDTSRIMPKSETGQEYIKILKKYSGRSNAKLSYGSIESLNAVDFYHTDRQAIILSSGRRGTIFDELNKNVDGINTEKFDRGGQMIFNWLLELLMSA